MRRRSIVLVGAGVVTALMLTVGPVGGQQAPAAAASTPASDIWANWNPPRTDFDPPRTPWGHPDLQGVYMWPPGSGAAEVAAEQAPAQRESYTVLAEGARTGDGSPATGDGPEFWYEGRYGPDGLVWEWDRPVYPNMREPLTYQPWAHAKREHIKEYENKERRLLAPKVRCLRRGVPQVNGPHVYVSVQFLQTPDKVVLMYEWNHDYRVIRLDGRPHVGSTFELWQGDPRGHWEGNTLVVESTNFNDKTWMGGEIGNFHSDAYRVVERFTPLDEHQIYYEAYMEDPNVFEKPWRKGFTFTRVWQQERFEQLEYACHEGNKAVDNILDGAANLALPPDQRK